MTLVKKDLADNLTKEIGLTKTEANSMVNAFFETIKETLLVGDDVKVFGFGNFTLRHKKARPARNPKTGEYALVSARNVVTFKTGGKLRKEMQLKADSKV